MSLNLSSTATKLLSSLGNPQYVKITRKSGGTFDPVAGETTGESVSVLDAVGAVTSVKASLVDGERIRATDKMIVLDGAIKPVMTDLITFAGVDNAIVHIDEVNHAGIPQIYKVVTRG